MGQILHSGIALDKETVNKNLVTANSFEEKVNGFHMQN
jgi:hypothetical protein